MLDLLKVFVAIEQSGIRYLNNKLVTKIARTIGVIDMQQQLDRNYIKISFLGSVLHHASLYRQSAERRLFRLLGVPRCKLCRVPALLGHYYEVFGLDSVEWGFIN